MSDWNLPGGQFGPPVRGGHGRGPDWRRVLLIVGSVLGIIGLAGAATFAGLVWYGEARIQRVAVAGRADPDAQPVREVLNVLLVGSDSREGLSKEQLQRLGTEDHGGKLTDTIMLLHLDPSRSRVILLSFPRDLLVTRCDGTRGRINAAYSIGVVKKLGGPSCITQTVSELTGVPIHHYVEVNFAGFINVVDTLGGVTMYFDKPLKDRAAGLDVPAGCVELDGVRALGFVRARKDLDSDFGRIARQQRFIGELLNKVTSAGVLLNVPRLFSLVDAVASSVEADHDLSLSDMKRIAFSLRGLTSDRVDMRSVPAHSRRVNGAAYVVAEEEEAQALFDAIREGRMLDDLGAEGSQAVTVGDVPPLVLLNGAGITGLAANARLALERYGFAVEATGNTSVDGRSTTTIYFPEARREEATLVGAAIPGATLVAKQYAGGQDVQTAGVITVVLGSSFNPDDVPAPPQPATPEPSAAATPTYAGATPAAYTC